MTPQDQNSVLLSEDEVESISGGKMSDAEREYVQHSPPSQQGLARIHYQERAKSLGSMVNCTIPISVDGSPLKPSDA